MKKEYWKYLSASLTIISVILLVYTFVSPSIADPIMKNNANLTTEIDITDNFENAKRVTLTTLDPNALDQSQGTTGSPSGIAIGYNPSAGFGYWAMQLGYNDREPLSGFQVMVSEHGTTTDLLLIGLMKGQLDPTDSRNWLWYGALNPGTLPKKDTYYWLTVEFDTPISIKAGQQWYITLISADKTDTSHFWAWGANPSNPYSRGMTRTWAGGSTWNALSGGTYDCCFKTYTVVGGGGGGEQPSVTISINTYLQTIGFISLLGACVSGIKYGTLVGWI